MFFDVIIIGAGAAGMMCGAFAGRRGRKVLILDHAREPGQKIAISGGGHCNFTNLHAGTDSYVSNNPHFCISALSRFTPADMIALVQKYRISFHEKKDGQLFCDGSAKRIVDLLVKECRDAGAGFKLNCDVSSIRPIAEQTGRFEIHEGSDIHICDSLVIATGGLASPKIGATPLGYKVARQFGLSIIDTAPALVPFALSRQLMHDLRSLTGVSTQASVACHHMIFSDSILITHDGLSGPAILQASLYWRLGDSLVINLVPNIDLYTLLIDKKRSGTGTELKTVLSGHIPKRLVERFCDLYFPSRAIKELSDEDIRTFCNLIQHWEITPGWTLGFDKAEVTRGGIDTNDLSSKTMEAKRTPGLFFIGEVVDVTGQLGGYNLHWAWASGAAAGEFA